LQAPQTGLIAIGEGQNPALTNGAAANGSPFRLSQHRTSFTGGLATERSPLADLSNFCCLPVEPGDLPTDYGKGTCSAPGSLDQHFFRAFLRVGLLCFHEFCQRYDFDILCQRIFLFAGIHNAKLVKFQVGKGDAHRRGKRRSVGAFAFDANTATVLE
jgi:hypothetical protein